MCVNAGGKIKMYIPCEREINGMKVLINGQVYEMGRKTFHVALNIAKESIPFGIYAVRKDDFCEMRKDTFNSWQQMNKQIVEYQKQGFQVYFNGGPK